VALIMYCSLDTFVLPKRDIFTSKLSALMAQK
jgi:hypothetical protein